jgi:tetratricopeptide (TPR) repeat protein
LLVAVSAIVPIVAASAQSSTTIDVAPSVVAPLAPTPEIYTVGFGGTLQIGVPAGTGALTPFARLGYANLSLASDAGGVNLVHGSAGMGYELVTVGPLSVGVEAGVGGYAAFTDGASVLINPTAHAGLRLGLGLGPGVRVTLRPGYDFHFARRDGAVTAFFSGVGTSLSVGIVPGELSVGERRPRIRIEEPLVEPVFPVIYKHYDTNPFGRVAIANEEPAAIDNVRVEFIAPQYMPAPQLIGEIDAVPRGETVQVPITALFSNELLDITETDAIQAQVRVSYEVGEHSLGADRTVTLQVYDRNTMTWDDDRKAAAFISGRDPSILRLSRNVTAAAAGGGVGAVNESFRKAVALFTALEEHGIEYQVDPESAYATLSRSETALDYLQFPAQTLDYRSGDCDDLSILYSSLLESVAIKTALITIPQHLFMAFSLGMSEDEARSTFSAVEDLIFVDGEAWVPVETTLIGDGFLSAWSTGAAQWREASSREAAGFFPIAEAHQVYAPTWFDSEHTDVTLPDTGRVVASYTDEMNRFVAREVEPLVRPLIERLGRSSSPRIENRIGTIYARYGKLDEARGWFERASLNNHVPAIVNLGNVSYLRGDLREARRHFQRASRISPDNPDVLIGLARVQFDLENYQDARSNMELAKVIAPERAEPFAYITGGGTQTGRASSAQRRTIIDWSE